MTSIDFLDLAECPAFQQRCVELDARFEAGNYMTVQECADFLGMQVHHFMVVFGPILLPHILVPQPVRPPNAVIN